MMVDKFKEAYWRLSELLEKEVQSNQLHLFYNTIPTYHHADQGGSVIECLIRDRVVAGSSLTGVTALWSLSKTHLS